MPVRLSGPRRRLAFSALAVAMTVAGAAALAPTTMTQAAPNRSIKTPRLVARATLSADYLAPGPQSGAEATPANGRTGPFDG